jgi:hypothetical protein
MSHDSHDDDLDARLRAVLRSRDLSLDPRGDAIDRIHAGARRRQQHRAVASGLAAIAVVAVAAGAVALRPTHHEGPSAGALSSSTVSATHSPTASSPSHPTSRPAATTPTTQATFATAAFVPLSVSAVNTNNYWVLGSTACTAGTCAALEHTTDAGKTFTRVGRMANGAEMPTVAGPNGGSGQVADVRFGDGQNGWLYGHGGVFTTHDGGATWMHDPSFTGEVNELAAASGNVWAISNPPAGGTTALYHATYGSGTSTPWTPVDLGGITPSSIGVLNGTAYAAGERSTDLSSVVAVVSAGGATVTSYAGPCPTQGTGDLSISGDGTALWLRCSTGNSGFVAVSTDGAKTWSQPSVSLTPDVVGGVDATRAVVSTAQSGIEIVSASGVTAATLPGVTSPNASFIGFTTAQVGFLVGGGPAFADQRLWRTTDGGATWSAVSVGV